MQEKEPDNISSFSQCMITPFHINGLTNQWQLAGSLLWDDEDRLNLQLFFAVISFFPNQRWSHPGGLCRLSLGISEMNWLESFGAKLQSRNGRAWILSQQKDQHKSFPAAVFLSKLSSNVPEPRKSKKIPGTNLIKNSKALLRYSENKRFLMVKKSHFLSLLDWSNLA